MSLALFRESDLLAINVLAVPALETKTALTENATECESSGRALRYDDDRPAKICALDAGRADRC